jgi:AIPR protein
MVTKKKSKQDRELFKQIQNSIEEYVNEQNELRNSVGIGNSFCEWVLYNIFELREDEVLDATEISGKFDNGIDAIFEYNGEICVLQTKYNNAHNIDAVMRFIADCQRVTTEIPVTDRDIVQEMCRNLRESHQNKETINCYYVTNNIFNDWEVMQINSAKKNIDESFNNLKFHFFDLEKIQEEIEIKKGMLPKEFRDKVIKLFIGKNFEESNTIVAVVKLRDFANFVNDGGNLLFHSNIRNYLKGTKINKGIKTTLKEEPERFWFYNNGVTIVCEDYSQQKGVVHLKAPQIVNGCQTAKTLADYFKTKTTKELNEIKQDGHLLVKIIRTKKSAEENEKKELRDNITRYTNSQNAVRGLDFYALDTFQRNLKSTLKQYGYYYEIQRGSFITEPSQVQKSFNGYDDYNYLLKSVKSSKKYVLPAKEVIQAFTAGIKQMPSVAYGRANELTPLGSKWDKIINEDTKNLAPEYFLFPYLILKYAKEELNYKTGASDFRKNAAFLFVATYFLFIMTLVQKVSGKEYESPEEIDIEIYKNIIVNQSLNEKLLNKTHGILKHFFLDSKIEEEVGDNLRGFLQNKIHKDKNWMVLKRKIAQVIDDLEFDNILDEIQALVNKASDVEE